MNDERPRAAGLDRAPVLRDLQIAAALARIEAQRVRLAGAAPGAAVDDLLFDDLVLEDLAVGVRAVRVGLRRAQLRHARSR